jgi:hypothetical protein
MTAPEDSDLKRDLGVLDQLLGDTRARFHRRQTPFASSEQLIAIDQEIRQVRGRPSSPGLDLEVRRLIERLRALDPH